MDTNKKWNVLFIKDDESLFDSNTNAFDQLFNKVNKVVDSDKVPSLLQSDTYDIVISDLTINPNKILLLKQIKDKNPKQTIFALVAPQDSDKLYKIADLNINAFELIPEQFDIALEEIAKFNPYE